MKVPISEHVVYTNWFFVFVLTFRTNYEHNLFWAWNFHVLSLYFDEQSLVILWVSWCNKCASEKDLPVLLITSCRMINLFLEPHETFCLDLIADEFWLFILPLFRKWMDSFIFNLTFHMHYVQCTYVFFQLLCTYIFPNLFL